MKKGIKALDKAVASVISWIKKQVGKGKTKGEEKAKEKKKGKGETGLRQKALDARNATLADIATWSTKKKQDVTTVAAGYDRKTGKVAVGINKTSINHGLICAEDLVVA